jgi:two-component system chemotaxis response regulator CheB
MYECVVICVSAGGMNALGSIFPEFSEDFPFSILTVQRIRTGCDTFLSEYINDISRIKVKEAQPWETVECGSAYFSPSGYQLLVDDERRINLSDDDPVYYSMPSVDVLFESAVDVYRDKLVAVILTGANDDGARGLGKIKEHGGLTVVQDPATTEAAAMPEATIKLTELDHILPLDRIERLLGELHHE